MRKDDAIITLLLVLLVMVFSLMKDSLDLRWKLANDQLAVRCK